jgi:hypothetical protein
MAVIGTFGHRLGLLQQILDIRQDCLAVSHSAIHRHNSEVTWFIGADGGRLMTVDHPERRIPEGMTGMLCCKCTPLREANAASGEGGHL